LWAMRRITALMVDYIFSMYPNFEYQSLNKNKINIKENYFY